MCSLKVSLWSNIIPKYVNFYTCRMALLFMHTATSFSSLCFSSCFAVICPNCNFVYFYVGNIFCFPYTVSSYHKYQVICECHWSGMMSKLEVKNWVILDVPEYRSTAGSLRTTFDMFFPMLKLFIIIIAFISFR